MNPHKHSSPGLRRVSKKSTRTTLSTLLALTCGAGLVTAQNTPTGPTRSTAAPTDEETVTLSEFVVHGLRGSAIKSIEIKRASPQFQESIVTEDIGKFPDNNLVESLQRLPGIQVTDYGRGNIASVTIRGLPDVTTTLNGRNIFTASGLALSLQDVPASLLKQVDIMKSRSASHIESGLAGVLDIQTFRPFDFARSKVSVAAKATYNEQREAWDPNVSALVSNRWKVGDEGSFGALLNVSYLTTTYRDQSATSGAQVPFTKGVQSVFSPLPYDRIWSGWTPGLDNGLPTAPGSTIPAGPGGAPVEYVLSRDAIFFNEGTGKTKRPAVNLSLQFAPNKNSEYTAEIFYLGYRNSHYSNLLFSFVDWWVDHTPATLDVTLFPGTNIVQRRGYIGNVYSFTSGDYVTGRTDSYQYSLGGRWDITPSLKLKSEFVYQESLFKGTNYFSRTIRDVRNDVAVNFNAGDGVPAFKYLDVAGTQVNEGHVADPSTWAVKDDGGVPEVWDQGFRNKGDALTFTQDADLHVDWGWIKKLKFGLRIDNRRASEAQRFAEADRTAGAVRLDALQTQFPGMVHVNKGFFDGRGDVPTSWANINGKWAFDNREKLRSFYTWRPTSRWNLKESFSIDELTSAAYVQADQFRADIAGRALTGQFGVRFVHIKTGMEFTDPAPNSTNRTHGNAEVHKLLPSAAFSYEITDKLLARIGYGETIRRPGFNDLNPLITYTRDVTNIGYGTASGGNPDLKPTTSRNIDLALEYYLDESSVMHLTLFRREIEGLVVPSRRRVTYTDAIGPYDYILSQPANASNGELEGFEIGGRYYPKTLPGFLQGFGIEASYTRLKSSQDIPMTDATGNVTGIRRTRFFLVSPDSYSVTLAYERSRLSARVSYAWRSEFHHHNEAPLFANPLQVYNADERSLTAQISYKAADNLVFTLEGTNLTDDVQHSYYGEHGRTINSFGNWIVGRTISLGARFSF
jgi:iron complex outermembrane recepter protein